jgi:ParB family chromosome partitioning protein
MKRLSGLGRGLGALIPQKDDQHQQQAPAPQAPVSRAAVVIGAGESRVESAPAPQMAPVASQPVASMQQPGTNNELPLTMIVPDPNQPRKMFKHRELEELSQSIREHGLIQPLTVARRTDGKYDLIAGERRYRAASMLGLRTVPVTFREADTQDKLLLALIENIQREDLNPIEEADGYRRLIVEFSLTQEDVAKKVGKARSTVANTLRLLELPDEIRDALAQGIIPAGSARAILSLKDAESQIRFYKKLVAEHLTTRDVEEGIRRRKGRATGKDPSVSAMEEQLRDALGSRVEIKSRAGRGAVIISFYSDEERDGLVKRLGA